MNPEKFMFHKSVDEANEPGPDPEMAKVVEEILKHRVNTPTKITSQEELDTWSVVKLKRPKVNMV
jgi:hypothetical protein